VPAPELTPNGQLPKWHVYEIDVQVAWGDSKRTVAITTLRTVSDAALKTEQQGISRRP
jgi:hypothetical protein